MSLADLNVHADNRYLSLSGYQMSTIIAQHALQLQKLKLSDEIGPRMFHNATNFPSLTEISVHSIAGPEPGWPWDVEEFIQIFRAAPNLLKFKCYYIPHIGQDNAGRKATHLESQSLRIHDILDARPLDYLTLPSLQRLHFICGDESGLTQLSPFLTRSSAPLLRLTLVSSNMLWTLDIIGNCFVLMPTLTHLVLRGPSPFHGAFITNLGDSPSSLPNLIDFTASLTSLPNDAWYEKLGAMLVTRRRKNPRAGVTLQSFHLKFNRWSDVDNHSPGANIKDITRALVADGMVITGMEQ